MSGAAPSGSEFHLLHRATDDEAEEATTLMPIPLTRLASTNTDIDADLDDGDEAVGGKGARLSRSRSTCGVHILLCAVLLGIIIGAATVEGVRRWGPPLPLDWGTSIEWPRNWRFQSAGSALLVPEAPVSESALVPVSSPSLLTAISPMTSNATGSLCLSVMDRFGNHVYMFMMAIKLAVQHGLQLRVVTGCDYAELFPAVPQFHAQCPQNEEVDMGVPPHAVDVGPWWDVDPRTKAHSPNFHVPLRQWFQYPTAMFAPYQQHLRELLTPHPKLTRALNMAKTELLREHCATSLIVSIHIRHGDFRPPNDIGGWRCVRLPVTWYFDWLRMMQQNGTDVLTRAKALQDKDCPVPVASNWTANDLTLFVISDDAAVPDMFREQGFRVIETAPIVTEAFGPSLAFAGHASGFYVDYWLYTQQRVIVTSHSTFSLTATLLSPHSERAGEGFFFRPLPELRGIGPFDPWNFHYVDDAFIGKV